MRLATALAAAVLLSTTALAQPAAKFETSMGNFEILLEDAKAPATVKNFVKYVKAGHYNNVVFYRIVPGFVIQAGSMKPDDSWKRAGKPIPLETATGLSNKRGTIAMAREEKPASATTEFFINLADTNAQGLDAKPADAPNTTGYAVFGSVLSGMDVVDAIAGVPLGGMRGQFPDNYPKKPVIIKKVTIIEVTPPPAPVAPATPAADPATAPASTPPATTSVIP